MPTRVGKQLSVFAEVVKKAKVDSVLVMIMGFAEICTRYYLIVSTGELPDQYSVTLPPFQNPAGCDVMKLKII